MNHRLLLDGAHHLPAMTRSNATLADRVTAGAGGVAIHARDHGGEGRPVVLLHGLARNLEQPELVASMVAQFLTPPNVD